MTTLFISDLHLDDSRPQATRKLLGFLSGEAAAADALYILGDLFEYWLGDDVATPTSEAVAAALLALARKGVPCFFMHGNRDFLLGEDYARKAGLSLLDEEHVAELYGQPTLLMHGDSLCTDDVAYQQVRQQVRQAAWQAEFLARTPAERIEAAHDARARSAEHKAAAGMEIMDVNADSVAAAFARHGVDRLIHGHTHRPAIHDLRLAAGAAQRIVLGDWYMQGSVLRVTPGDLDLAAMPF